MAQHNMSCQSCRYCVEIEAQTHVCRRYPPQLYKFKDQFHSLYPPINDPINWWCGEFQVKFSSGAN